MATIKGTNFQPGAQVTFGGQPADSVVWVSSTEITCSPPAHAGGAVDVRVINPDGSSATAVSAYTYLTPPPAGYAMWASVASLADGAVSSFATTGSAPPTFVQATGADQPVKSSSPNVITFDGVNDILTDSTTNVLTLAFTVGMKFKFNVIPTSLADWQVLLQLKNSGGSGLMIAAAPVSGYGNILVAGTTPNTGGVGIFPTLDTSVHRLIATYNGGANNAPASYQIWYDGVLLTSTAASATVSSTVSTLGEWQSGSQAFNGKMYDVLAYPTVLSAGSITALDAYLQGL